jgi:hypothetical protein
MPSEPLEFSAPFKVASREGEVPERRYRLGVRAGEQVGWGREGRKEEVSAANGEEAGLEDDERYEAIRLSGIEEVEFEVGDADA